MSKYKTPAVDEINVGHRLRELRNQQGLSIRALAELSGLNFNTLSLIENRKTSPSVSTLQQIATALGVPITAFFTFPQERKKIVFQRYAQRPHAIFPNGVMEDLGGGLTLHGGKPLLVSLEPGADSGPVPIVHTGQEFVYCLQNCLLYRIESQEYLLEPGDSLIFEAHLPHWWGNPGTAISQTLLILCPAEDSDRPTERHFMTQ